MISTTEQVKLFKNVKGNHHGPWSTIQIIGGISVPAQISAEKRVGCMCFKLHGEVPDDLVVLISEYYTTVTNANCTWRFDRQTGFTIYPSE